ncbi:putative Ribonuclease H-like domain-containing protein [Seiridium cardinale]
MHYSVNIDALILYKRRYILATASYGLWMGTVFEAPANLSSDSVSSLRPINSFNNFKTHRFYIRHRYAPTFSDLETMAAYADGACSSNGLAALKGGFAFVFNNTSTG